jgi:2-oxoglutarate ferredoxin oxidoreductase subunit gamma
MAGSGGQGIVLLGRILATAALKSRPHLTFFPNYGAEVRGGNSNCQVILSNREISSPVAARFDAMILMDHFSFAKYSARLADDGLAVVNQSLCPVAPSRTTVAIPASETAEHLGDIRVANLVMLGALLARRRYVPAADVEHAIRLTLQGKNPHLLPLNLLAFQTGMRL